MFEGSSPDDFRETPTCVSGTQLVPAANRRLADDDLREGHHSGPCSKLSPSVRILRKIDLVVLKTASVQQGLGAGAIRAGLSRVHSDPGHQTRDCSVGATAGWRPELKLGRTLETEGIVLRSIRYGEADRILQIYTPGDGRLSAIAKGARRTKSRFGARLEPMMRVNLMLRLGKGEISTVSGVETVSAHAGILLSAGAIDCAARACDATSRLLDGPDPHPQAYNLLANTLAALDADPSLGTPATQLAFRLKLLVACGFGPQLSGCASCGAQEAVSGFSGAAGGTICDGCAAEGFPISPEAHGFLVSALGRPISEPPRASQTALRQAERVIGETVEHHAQVRLRSAGAR